MDNAADSRAVNMRRPPGKYRRQEAATLPAVDSAVKSAKRVFDVLEFFEDLQRPASAMEVATTLKFPLSSTSALMRTMTGLGYLHYDPSRRDYTPTARISMLGHWLSPALFNHGRLLSLMEDLAEKTNETIMIGLRNGLSAQYIHVIQARLPMRLHMKAGTLRPLARSGLGYALMSTYPEREVRRLVRKINEHEPEAARKINIKELLGELERVREKGHAISVNLVTPGAGVVAMTLPKIAGTDQPLALCVAGLTDALLAQEQELADLMARAISFHLSE